MIDRLVLLLLVAGSLLFGTIVFAGAQVGRPGRGGRQAGRQHGRYHYRSRAGSRVLGSRSWWRQSLPGRCSAVRGVRRSVADDSASADGDLADTRLTGIVTEPGRRIAIFAVSGGKPLKVAEGDEVSGWRIESITPREISLSGPSGTKTLQPKLDPNLAQAPPGPTRPRTPRRACRPPTARPAGSQQPNGTVPGVPRPIAIATGPPPR